MQCGTHRGIKIENKIFFVCFCLLFYSVLELGIEVVMVHHIFVEVVFDAQDEDIWNGSVVLM